HIRALFAERTTVMLDLPGHGRTTGPVEGITTDHIAHIISDFLDQLNIPQVDIVGYSLGGYIGLALARFSPKRVRSVVTHAMKFYWTPEAIDSAIATFAKAPVEAHTINTMASIIDDF